MEESQTTCQTPGRLWSLYCPSLSVPPVASLETKLAALTQQQVGRHDSSDFFPASTVVAFCQSIVVKKVGALGANCVWNSLLIYSYNTGQASLFNLTRFFVLSTIPTTHVVCQDDRALQLQQDLKKLQQQFIASG